MAVNLSKIAHAYGFKLDYRTTPKNQQQKCFDAVFEACTQERWGPLEKCKDAVAELTDDVGRSLLIRAVELRNGKVCAELVKRNVGPLLADGNGDTALHIAARLGNLEFAKVLCLAIPLDVRNVKGETPLNIIEAKNHKAQFLEMLRNFANNTLSHDAYRVALPLLKQILLLAPQEAESFSFLQKMADCHAGIEEIQEAVNLYERALKLAPTALNFRDIIQLEIANCYVFLKRYKEALAIYDKIGLWLSDHLGGKSPTMAIVLGNVGLCHMRLECYDRAVQSFEEARCVWEELEGKDALIVVTILNTQALCYMGDKQYEKAIEKFEQSIVTLKKKNDQSPHIKDNEEHIALCREKIRKLEK